MKAIYDKWRVKINQRELPVEGRIYKKALVDLG